MIIGKHDDKLEQNLVPEIVAANS